MKKVLVDTNILASLTAFPGKVTLDLWNKYIVGKYEIVISDCILMELQDIYEEKVPEELQYTLDLFLKNTEYTYVVVDRSILTPSIRDEKDVHVLQAIIEFNVDILLTGDKDFNEVELEGVEITNLRKFSIINIPDSNILWVIEVWEKLVNHN